MPDRKPIDELIFSGLLRRRLVQDSPVLPDIWRRYWRAPKKPADLLLTPHRNSRPGTLSTRLREALRNWEDENKPELFISQREDQDTERLRMVYNESYVVANLWFDQLVRCALPLTPWWWTHVWPAKKRPAENVLSARDKALSAGLLQDIRQVTYREGARNFTEDAAWLVRIVGQIAWMWMTPGWRSKVAESKTDEPTERDVVLAALTLMEGMSLVPPPGKQEGEQRPLWLVSRNREASTAVWRSTATVKADAAQRVFELSCEKLRWAVIDSGVDATHPAFGKRDAQGKLKGFQQPPDVPQPQVPASSSRVVKTFDFTRMRDLLDPEQPDADKRERADALKHALHSGRYVDWDELLPLLAVKQDSYRPPLHQHGTHVAGILAADWKRQGEGMPADEAEHDLSGMCPDLELYDLRVLGDDGRGDEFSILAALQFVRYLNANRDTPVIHGVNLSLALWHDVTSFACGRTPVCEECTRLVGAGVVVVAAAGNAGYNEEMAAAVTGQGYQDITITDPGNAEDVITVGSTHRHMPHAYGVSYFSSRGPTGDGRPKPDLVAPGEKIKSTVPSAQFSTMDGTSMAAPHVSGAAALLMARHRELVGDPFRVKEILCKTATDLHRERHFQGAGLLDILRALQSV